ncbi:hypothetical protein pb186bvf_007635 [Paramecium bursaria]
MYKILYKFSKSINYYTILELNPSCTQRQIKQNYNKLVKIYHPDLYKGDDRKRFQLIQEAYSTLKSPEKRQIYDQQIKGGVNDAGINVDNTKYEEQDQDNKESTDQTHINYKFKVKDYLQAKEDKSLNDEFVKIMTEPPKVNVEKINITENPLRRQLDQELKEQVDFVDDFNYKKFKFLYKHQIGYQAQVDYYIDSRNKQAKQQTFRQKFRNMRADFYARFGNTSFLIFVAVCSPILYSVLSHRLEITKEIDEVVVMVNNIEEVVETLKVSERMKY